jgi:hypothetical protein
VGGGVGAPSHDSTPEVLPEDARWRHGDREEGSGHKAEMLRRGNEFNLKGRHHRS